MSTTWVFVGLLAGRDAAFATITGKYKFKTVFPLIGKDFFKMMIGLALSMVIVFLIHGLFPLRVCKSNITINIPI